MDRATAATAIVFLWAASPSAQSLRPPVEFGAAFGRLATTPYEDFLGDGPNEPTFDVRATVPLTPRFAVEGLFTVGRSGTEFTTRTEGLFIVQVKQRLESGTRGNFHPFLIYGVAGYWARVSQEEVRVIDDAGRLIVSPAFRYTEIDEPVAAVIGGGIQHAFARRAAVRCEAQLVTLLYIPLGARLSAGVSIPIGRSYDAR